MKARTSTITPNKSESHFRVPASCGFLVVLLFGVNIWGCGGSSEKPKPASVAPAPANPNTEIASKPNATSPAKATGEDSGIDAKKSETPAADSNGIGTLSGRVVIDGAPPVLKALVAKGQEGVRDAAVCAVHEIPDESLLVGEGNGVANVFVYLGSAPKGAVSPVPTEPIVFDQKGCRYVPHALVVRTNQLVLVKSDDAVQHNVHSVTQRNAPFNQIIPANDRAGLKMSYEQAEREPVEVKCDIHPWMRAYQLPLDHQFAAVTDANGRFEIKDLPAGKLEFRIWHERPKYLERKYQVVIKPGEATNVEIKFPVAKFAVIDNRPLRVAGLSMQH